MHIHVCSSHAVKRKFNVLTVSDKEFCIKRTLRICSDEIHSDKLLINEFFVIAEPFIDDDKNISRVVDDTTINVDAQAPVKFLVWVSFAEIYHAPSMTYWNHVDQERAKGGQI